MVFVGYAAALAYGILCLLLSLFTYKLGVDKRLTRKIVHILVGAEWFILYHTVGIGIHFVAVCIVFTILLYIVHRFNAMPMISSDGDNAPGTVYYGVSMTIMAIVSCFVDGYAYAFGIAVLCTSLGDGFAGVVGGSVKRFNPKMFGSKTVFGVVSAFVVSFVSTLLFSKGYSLDVSALECLLVAVLVCGVELICVRGLDNIAIPLSASLLYYAFMYFDDIYLYIIPIMLTPFIICAVLSKRLLTVGGVVCAVIIDMAVSISLGNFGFVLMLSFLLLSVCADKAKGKAKKQTNGPDEEGKRDHVQVFANGFIPSLLALLYLLTNSYVFIIGYSAALAECLADTFASGIGAFSKTAYDPFRMKKVENGLSGGMSVIGTLTALVSPFVFLLISVGFGAIYWNVFIICGASAFIGTVIDSMLGSLVQAKYKCKKCGLIIEKEYHCLEKADLISGTSYVDNNTVNLISCFASAMIAMIVTVILA